MKIAEDMESSEGEVIIFGVVSVAVAVILIVVAVAVILIVFTILVRWKRKGKHHSDVPIDNPIYSGVMQHSVIFMVNYRSYYTIPHYASL